VDLWAERCLLQYTEASRRLQVNHKDYVAARNAQQQLRADIEDNARQTAICDERRRQFHSEQVRLEAQRQGISALKDKDELERRIADGHRMLGEKARPLLESGQQISRNTESTRRLLEQLSAHSLGVDIPLLEKRDFRQQAKEIANAESGVDFSQLLARDWVGLEGQEAKLDAIIALESQHRRWAERLHGAQDGSSLRDQIALLRSARERRHQDLLNKLKQKEKEVLLL